MGEILKDIGLQVNKSTLEISIRTQSKKVVALKAASYAEAQDWADCIAAWMEAISADK